MGPIGILIIVVLGIFVPFAVIVAFPLRALYLIFFAEKFARIWSGLLLLPWAYFLSDILRFGYVSVRDRSTGPTVEPRVWLLLGVTWFILEVVSRPLQEGVEDADDKAGGSDA